MVPSYLRQQQHHVEFWENVATANNVIKIPPNPLQGYIKPDDGVGVILKEQAPQSPETRLTASIIILLSIFKEHLVDMAPLYEPDCYPCAFLKTRCRCYSHDRRLVYLWRQSVESGIRFWQASCIA